MATDERTRIEILKDLIELRKPVPDAVEAAAAVPWDRTYDLVVFNKDHVRAALKRFLAGEESADNLEAWAELVQGREDIAIDEGERELIVQFLVEISTPELFGALSDGSAEAWLDRLSHVVVERDHPEA